jgi:hypothetical protein
MKTNPLSNLTHPAPAHTCSVKWELDIDGLTCKITEDLGVIVVTIGGYIETFTDALKALSWARGIALDVDRRFDEVIRRAA